jgi:hypothetical protein
MDLCDTLPHLPSAVNERAPFRIPHPKFREARPTTLNNEPRTVEY